MASKVVEFQYELFETHQERFLRMRLEETERNLAAAIKTLDKVRKGAYAKLNEVNSRLQEQQQRLELIERSICRKDNL